MIGNYLYGEFSIGCNMFVLMYNEIEPDSRLCAFDADINQDTDALCASYAGRSMEDLCASVAVRNVPQRDIGDNEAARNAAVCNYVLPVCDFLEQVTQPNCES